LRRFLTSDITQIPVAARRSKYGYPIILASGSRSAKGNNSKFASFNG
jgi:hypothetical protein